MEIRNVVFDLGGVIADLELRPTMERLHRVGLPLPETMLSAPNPMNTLMQMGEIAPLIQRMDCGEISGREFAEMLRQYIERAQGATSTVTTDDLISIYKRMIVVPRERIAWIAGLRKHYRVLLLSNIGDIHWEYFQEECSRQGYPVGEMFDDIFVSYKLRVAKPDERIFQHLISQSGIKPEETLYIDDSLANIEVGASLGLQACHIAPNSLDDKMDLDLLLSMVGRR